MKKIVLTVVLLGGIAAALFAWEPEDFLLYPSCTEENDFLVNVGAGLGLPAGFTVDYKYIPPVRASLDYNLAIEDYKLPFFVGGTFGYSGFGYKDEYYCNVFSLGARFGYHFNWNVDKLDTYALVTLGWILRDYSGGGYSGLWLDRGLPLAGISVGARYFLTDIFGFWAEIGWTTFSLIDIGITFKF